MKTNKKRKQSTITDSGSDRNEDSDSSDDLDAVPCGVYAFVRGLACALAVCLLYIKDMERARDGHMMAAGFTIGGQHASPSSQPATVKKGKGCEVCPSPGGMST